MDNIFESVKEITLNIPAQGKLDMILGEITQGKIDIYLLEPQPQRARGKKQGARGRKSFHPLCAIAEFGWSINIRSASLDSDELVDILELYQFPRLETLHLKVSEHEVDHDELLNLHTILINMDENLRNVTLYASDDSLEYLEAFRSTLPRLERFEVCSLTAMRKTPRE